ncbi:putative lipid II flippase FtsW [Halobacillus sp. B23F22_1]|uniref:putative lipid II flippase FtsW n=1 Tax=Halobacillus sp. B23F22_1 TaxID=3459514 RepID=UPI00373EDACE
MFSKLKKIDLPLVAVLLFLASIGIIMVFSASYPLADRVYNDSHYFFKRQFIWAGIGLLSFLAAALLPYRLYGKLSPFLVLFSFFVLLLVLIPGIGLERNNSQRWIGIGPMIFQPTEAVKLCMLIYFAHIYAKKQRYINEFKRGVLPPLLILGAIFLLILQQPDLGSASLILVSCGFIVLCSGVKGKHLFMLGSIAAVGISYFAYSSPYRMQRLLSFVNVFDDPSGEGYQLVNSYFAIANGGLFGNGIGNSIQKTGYLPESHTDFIMAIIIEETGILGLACVILSYVFIMYRGVYIANRATNHFQRLLAIGLTFQIMLQAAFNLGAVSGLLPITGITLPFISYGGSSLVFTMISAGILVNLSADLIPQPFPKRSVQEQPAATL